MSIVGESYQKLITYFVAQVFGRFVILLAALSSPSGALLIALTGVVFKIGFVGGHIWAGGFVRGLSSSCANWFLVAIKVGPLAVILGSLPLTITGILTTLVGLMYISVASNILRFLYWGGLVGSSWLLMVEGRVVR